MLLKYSNNSQGLLELRFKVLSLPSKSYYYYLFDGMMRLDENCDRNRQKVELTLG